MFQKLVFLLLLLAWNGAPSAAQKRAVPPSLSEKVSQLSEWASRKPVIRMNGDMFHRFVETPPRNYSVVVMFTASRQPGDCTMCREAAEEFRVLANAWRHSSAVTASADRVFFATVDLAEASDVFKALHLETVPALLHFPPPDKGKAPSEYDLDNRGHLAPHMAAWVTEETGVRLHVTPPPDLTKPFILGLLLALAAALAYLKRLDRIVWAFSALFCVLLMTSGQVWNHIRGPPFAYRHPENRQQLTFVHPSAQAQFGAEAYVVAAFNAAATAGIVLLCEVPSGGGGRWGGIKGRCLAGNVLVLLSFTCLETVFRAKH